MDEVVAAIYPIPSHLKDRLFDGKAKVFVKFLPHNSTKLGPKDKIIFYVSGGSKRLIGEGVIHSLEFLAAQNVISKYRELLFLRDDEFHTYIKSSPMRAESKEMLTLMLKDLREYTNPIEYNRPMTMAGRYLTAAEYSTLMYRKSSPNLGKS